MTTGIPSYDWIRFAGQVRNTCLNSIQIFRSLTGLHLTWAITIENGFFEYGDGIVLFCMLRMLRPARVIEVGSGFSSGLMLDVNERFYQNEMELRFIDPYPERLRGLLRETDQTRCTIMPQKLQDVPLEHFKKLEHGDILFLDSSHVLKTSSDVNDYFFRILPALRAGVIIHIHNMFYPFEYPYQWAVKDNRSWNEIYAVRLFLQYNTAFRILYFNHYMARKSPQRLTELMPLVMKNAGGGSGCKSL